MLKKGFFTTCVLSLAVQASCAATSGAQSFEQKRFLEGLDALKSKDQTAFHSARNDLNYHPLDILLQYRYLSNNLDKTEEVSSFIQEEGDTYYAKRLQKRWLGYLGKNSQWKKYLETYQASDNEALRCYYQTAKLKTAGPSKSLFSDASHLWLKGGSVDDACDPLFDSMYSNNTITRDLLWQRIFLASDKKKISLAKFLGKKLQKSDQLYLDRLLQAQKNPKETLMSSLGWKDNSLNRRIIRHALLRYSRKDTLEAWTLWNHRFTAKFAFSETEQNELTSKLALRAAWRHMPEAVEIFHQIPTRQLSQEALEWRVRTAIRYGLWSEVISYIAALDANEEEWQYWKGRALDKTGHSDQGDSLLKKLAENTSYYGFVAADNLGLDYQFTDEPVVDEAAAKNVEQLKQQSAFQRIKDLYDLGMTGEAYSEWMFEVQRMPDEQKRVAARLAHNWQWHFTAIVTTARAKHFADLELRFPLLYTQHIYKQAEKYQVRPSLIYGIIRRESAFKETAVSPAGAMGLMQVMPRTARMVAKKMGEKKPSRDKIKEVGFNIRLGSHYLKQVLDQYENHEILATASYNAGPHRVKKWLPETGQLPSDVWIDSITFDETRKYVKAVHFYSVIFDWKDNGKVDFPLKNRMTPVFSPSVVNLAALKSK